MLVKDIRIRPAAQEDWSAIWRVIEPVILAGDAFAFEGVTAPHDVHAVWFGRGAQAYLAELEGQVVGTYVIKPNQPGRGSHIANGAYAVHPDARGQGVARAMGEHSIQAARQAGYRAMQFNLVVSTNQPAVALWKSLGFEVLATLPGAFRRGGSGHEHFYVDALVMWRQL